MASDVDPAPSGATGSYDPEMVLRAAVQRDPALDWTLARDLADRAWAHLVEVGRPDAPEVARRLLAESADLDASAASIVASAAAEFCESYAVPLSG